MTRNIQELEQTRSDIYHTKYIILKLPEFSLIHDVKFKIPIFREKNIVSLPGTRGEFQAEVYHADKENGFWNTWSQYRG